MPQHTFTPNAPKTTNLPIIILIGFGVIIILGILLLFVFNNDAIKSNEVGFSNKNNIVEKRNLPFLESNQETESNSNEGANNFGESSINSESGSNTEVSIDASSSNASTVGDRIQTVGLVAVVSDPYGIYGVDYLGNQPEGATGQVIQVYGNWRKINFDSGPSGWVTEQFLGNVGVSRPGPLITSGNPLGSEVLYTVGDKVRAFSKLTGVGQKVLITDPGSAEPVFTISAGTTGEIVEGPRKLVNLEGGLIYWWKIKFDNGTDSAGQTAQNPVGWVPSHLIDLYSFSTCQSERRVSARSKIFVVNTPQRDPTIIGVQFGGSRGKIIEGPAEVDYDQSGVFTYCNVQWDGGPVGWVDRGALTPVDSTPPNKVDHVIISPSSSTMSISTSARLSFVAYDFNNQVLSLEGRSVKVITSNILYCNPTVSGDTVTVTNSEGIFKGTCSVAVNVDGVMATANFVYNT